MKTIIPSKLKKGDIVAIIAPSRSLSILSEEIQKNAISWLEGFRLKSLSVMQTQKLLFQLVTNINFFF